MARLEPCFPKSHGKPRVDGRRVLSEIILISRNGLRCRDAPIQYGPHKTLYSRGKRWSEKGIFARMMAGLGRARQSASPYAHFGIRDSRSNLVAYSARSRWG